MSAVDADQIYSDRIGQLYYLEHVALFATVVCSSMLVVFHWGIVSHKTLLTWLAALLFVTAVRTIPLIMYRRSADPRAHARKWAWVFIAGAFAAGVCWGSSIIFLFPEGSLQHQLITVLVLGGMIAGAVGAYSASIRAFAAFAVPCSIPMLIQVFFWPDYFHVDMGIMVLIFMLFISATAWRVNRIVVNSLELRHENRGLVEFLGEGKERAEVLNERLQAEISERAKVEAELIEHREHLERIVEERTSELITSNAELLQQMNSCRLAERSLLESEERYRILFEYSNDCIFLHDIDGRIIGVNLKVLEEFGFTEAEILAKNIRDLHPPSAIEKIDQASEEIEEHGFADFEVPFLRKSGEIFHGEVSAGCFELRGGRIIQRIVRNVTERKLMEKELKQTRKYLENLIHNAVDAIGIVNKEGKFVLWNKRAHEIYGYDAEEMKRRHYSSLYADPQARDEVLAILRQEGVVRQRDLSMKRKDGQEVPMELSINLLRGDDGETVGSLCVARDLSEKKLLEAQLLHAQKMEAVGTLAGGIAHDFNNLLHAIQGYSELLLFDRKESEKGYRELHEISRAAMRGGDLSKQLLTFSRKVEPKLRPMNLNIQVKQSVRLLERTIPKMIAIDLKLQDGLSHIKADSTQIEQILINLAVNAKDAMPNEGRLTIETRDMVLSDEFCRMRPGIQPGLHVNLSVADTGLGIDKETIKSIFDPFFTTKEVGEGTGLGLAIVYGIVKSHGGHIECTSEPGAGTRFDIYMPALEFSEKSGATRDPQPPRGRREYVLVVDDEEGIREVSEHILKKYGYSVLTARDGETALETYAREKGRIGVVILDLIMPGMGGRQCLGKLLEIDPKAKIIVVSGHFTEAEAIESTALGARSIIRKPFEANELLTCVRSVLDQ